MYSSFMAHLTFQGRHIDLQWLRVGVIAQDRLKINDLPKEKPDILKQDKSVQK